VRVESTARQRVHRVLDFGAHGIMFPHIDTGKEAEAAVAAMRYPPAGVRGVAFSNRPRRLKTLMPSQPSMAWTCCSLAPRTYRIQWGCSVISNIRTLSPLSGGSLNLPCRVGSTAEFCCRVPGTSRSISTSGTVLSPRVPTQFCSTTQPEHWFSHSRKTL
jgi:hypothetical protein